MSSTFTSVRSSQRNGKVKVKIQTRDTYVGAESCTVTVVSDRGAPSNWVIVTVPVTRVDVNVEVNVRMGAPFSETVPQLCVMVAVVES